MSQQCPCTSYLDPPENGVKGPHKWYSLFQIGPFTLLSKCSLCSARRLF